MVRKRWDYKRFGFKSWGNAGAPEFPLKLKSQNDINMNGLVRFFQGLEKDHHENVEACQ